MTPRAYKRKPSADRFYLKEWEELVGRLEEVQVADGELVVILTSGTLVFPSDSTFADHLMEELENQTGERVSILRTDFDDEPYLVTIEDNA